MTAISTSLWRYYLCRVEFGKLKHYVLSLVSTCTLKGAWDMSEVPVTHIFYCAWLKTQVETCVTDTLDMSQAPLRHKWKPGFSGHGFN